MADNDAPTVPPTAVLGRRKKVVIVVWIITWMAYLGSPVSDLLGERHGSTATFLGWIGLSAFGVGYFVACFPGTRPGFNGPSSRAATWGLLLSLSGLAVVLSLSLGEAWLVLFVYVSVAFGLMLPRKLSVWWVPAVSVGMVLVGLAMTSVSELLPDLFLPALLGGFVVIVVRHQIRTMVALRDARATVAQLAAADERLRLARDLHDLLGHSLSLITLKSELAGRMLPGAPEQAAQQVTDIEQVSRQALVDVREAVNGYRRPTLETESAGARSALAAAQISSDLTGVAEGHPGLGTAQEGALAWGLREAVTNVVRHSGARHCRIDLVEVGDELRLSVTDDGQGAQDEDDGGWGHGLAGLAERLHLANGRLETGPSRERGRHRGFQLRAYVPLDSAARRSGETGSRAAAHPSAGGTGR